MAVRSLDHRLAELEQCRSRFSQEEAARVVKLLSIVETQRFSHIPSLIRFHEALLFLRAFPHNASVLHHSERLLQNFSPRVEQLRHAGADMEQFDPLEVSGLAGTTMQDTLSFDVVRWLVCRIPGNAEIVWDGDADERALAAVWPRFIPLLEEDAYVEAGVPWRRWLQEASGSRKKSLKWLLDCVQELPFPDPEKAQLYDSLRVTVRWNLDNLRLSRTRNWKPAPRAFYHKQPLISRSEVSLGQELTQPPPVLRRLSLSQGEAVMNLIREVMLVRYRELYGTTLGDPRSVVCADVGRGVSIFLWNLAPERRLPLRAYVAGFTVKNGVPINYVEAIGLFEWMEVGFNTFYTFRGGEVAWIFAQALRCLCHLTGATCISMYPYQLGHGNEEAIESGAFWFYRKLGFRPGRPDLRALVEREEQRITRDPKYRTSPRTLRRLAEGHVFYELSGSDPGAWDTFSTRNIGLRVNQRMAQKFQGHGQRFRLTASKSLARILDVQLASWRPQERVSFENFGLVLSLIPDLSSWASGGKQALWQAIRAKTAPDEMRYLHLLQRHRQLREALLKLGSSDLP
jgi:hypothetical protein